MARARVVEENPFRTFWSLGYRRLVPVIPPAAPLSERSTMHKRLLAGKDPRGKVPGVKGEDGLWRGLSGWHELIADEWHLDRWAEMGASVGIKTGDQGDGTSLIGIDADTLDEDLANAVSRYVSNRFGSTPIRIGRAPKALYVVRLIGRFPNRKVFFGPQRDQVDFLSDGKQFVAHGIHPVTREPYRWIEPPPNIDTLTPREIELFQ